MSNENKTRGSGRTRNFATIVYPESAPSNWREVLENQCIPAFISPLHNNDIDTFGEPKKAHYHVIIMFETVKTNEQAKEVFNSIGGVGLEVVKSLRSYARYLCHLDNADKAKYNVNEVVSIGGVDYESTVSSSADEDFLITEMEEFCEKYNVVSFYALCRYATKKRPDWKRMLNRKCSLYMREYLNSRKWSIENGFGDIVDEESGEIIN